MNRTMRRYTIRVAIAIAFVIAGLITSGGYKNFELGDLAQGGKGTSYQRPSGGSGEDGKAITTNCERPDHVVQVDQDKYPNVLAHAREAVAKGWPKVMVLNREGAGARRDKLLQNVDTKKGFDRDEFPAAVGRGKAPGSTKGNDPVGWEADVKYVESRENRSAGSSMGVQMRRYCDGTRFTYKGL